MAPAKLLELFPNIHFRSGKTFVWSPSQQAVYYDPKRINTKHGLLALLHEVGHALLKHQTYEYDIELLKMELDAWSQARSLASKLKLKVVDEEHIDNCLETYRVWIYKRSRCPSCENTSLQQSARYYQCFLCNSKWEVAQNRTTQPRRMKCTLGVLSHINTH